MVRERIGPAWRYFLVNWAMLATMGAALALVLTFTRFTIEPASVLFPFGFVIVYAAFAHANARSPARRDPQVMFVLGATAQIVLVTALMTPFTYVAAAAQFPLQDSNLLAIDRVLGLDWRTYLEFVDAHPLLASWLSSAYSMIRWPIFAIPVVLAAAHRYQRLQAFTFAFGMTLIVTTIISALVPAYGIFHGVADVAVNYPNLNVAAYADSARELPLVRNGTIRNLDLLALTGLVTFPSFHAASAALYAWALWPVRWIRPIAVLVNTAMLAATPVDGAHYFIDIAAGLAVAACGIWAANAVRRRLLAPRTANGAFPKDTELPAAIPSSAVG